MDWTKNTERDLIQLNRDFPALYYPSLARFTFPNGKTEIRLVQEFLIVPVGYVR